MKKNYVNLELQVVDVQLSDCIAGSVNPNVNVLHGTVYNHELVDVSKGGNGSIEFGGW